MTVQNKEESEILLPRRVFAVSDYEIANGNLKFFNQKGLLKRKAYVVREIPISEIGSVESYWNELSITWNGITNIFFKKNSLESFSELRDKIRSLVEEHQRIVEKTLRAQKIKGELIFALRGVMPIVDMCFDILMSLTEKRVDWKLVSKILSDYSKTTESNLIPSNQMLPELTLSLFELTNAVTMQSPPKVAAEANNILKLIYEYFDNLNLKDDLLDLHPNKQDATKIISSYYALNDIFFGKKVGDKDSKKESLFLESSFVVLSEELTFKVDIEEIKLKFDVFGSEEDKGSFEDSRVLFKDELYRLLKIE